MQKVMKTSLTAWGGPSGSQKLRLAGSVSASIKHFREEPGLSCFALCAKQREVVDRMAVLLPRIGAKIPDEGADFDYAPAYDGVYFSAPDRIKSDYVPAPAMPA